MRRVLVLLCVSYVISEILELPEGSPCTWHGVKGQCVKVHRCYGAIEDITDKNYPPICSYEGKTPVLCCTDCELVDDTRLMLIDHALGVLNKTGTNKAKDMSPTPVRGHMVTVTTKHLNEKNNCYEYRSETLRLEYVSEGGRDATRDEFPHMALLGYGSSAESADWLCGGSVISERFVLTAAHCNASAALGPVKYVTVGILRRSDPSEYWQHTVKRFIPHPEYKPPSKYHDIALIETDKDMEFGRVLPACLHMDDQFDEEAEATGWGALGDRKGLADTLQSVVLSRFSKEECSERFPQHRHMKNGFDHDTQMCYGEMEDVLRDTCEGDSGGPLQSWRYKGCVYMVLGVTSFGRRCGSTRSSGVYTRVKHYVPWIESIVWP